MRAISTLPTTTPVGNVLTGFCHILPPVARLLAGAGTSTTVLISVSSMPRRRT